MVSKLFRRNEVAPKKKVAAPKPPPKKAAEPKKKPLVARDELSTGRGSALRAKGLNAIGAKLKAELPKLEGKGFKLAELLAARKAGTDATSLRTERLGDGKANCLENAVNLAKPGDNVVLLTDKQDPVGHAVVQRKDGSVLDPNRPEQPYTSLASFQQANPRYGNPAIVSDVQAERILRTEPGAERNRLITEAGLDGVASRAVADPPRVTQEYDARATTEAAQVQEAYDQAIGNGGSPADASNAAAKELDRLVQAANDPTYVAKLVEKSAPTIALISAEAGRAARNEGDRSSDQMKETMRLLAGVADKGGTRAATVIADELAGALPDDTELEEIDDALFEHIGGGGETTLARALHDGLRSAGKLEAAKGLADNEHGTDLELAVVNEARAALDGGASPQEIADRYGEYLTTHIGEAVSRGEGEDTEPAVELLADLADRGGPELAQSLAQKLASKVPNASDLVKLDDKLHDLAGSGRGVSLSVSLVSELQAAGKTQAAAELTDVVTRGIDHLRGEYESAQNKVDDLNAQLASYVGSFGELLTPQQKTDAINAFKEKHAEDYARLERAAQQFGQNIDAIADAADPNGPLASLPAESREAIRDAANRAIVNVYPRLGDTTAGSEVVADQLEKQGRGEPSALDVITTLQLSDAEVKEYASDETESLGISDWVGFQKGAAETAFKGAALRIATNPGSAQNLTEGLLRNSEALGVPRAKLQAVLTDVQALATTTDPAQRAVIEGRIRTNTEDLGILDAETRAGQAFRGFATVLGVVSAAEGISNWGDASNIERIQTVAGALDTGIGAYELVLGVTGRAASISALAGRAAGVLGGLGAVLEGISAVDSFRNGDYVSGTGHSLTAIGSGVLAAAAIPNLVPVAGQIAAGVLIAVGFGLTQWARVQEANKNEGPVQDFLEGAGLSPKLAEELSNHTGNGYPAGPALIAVAERLGLSGPELLTHLQGKSESELQRLIENAVHQVELEGDDDARAFPETGDDVERIRRYYETTPRPPRQVPPEPDSIEGLAVWMQYNGYLPAGVTA